MSSWTSCTIGVPGWKAAGRNLTACARAQPASMELMTPGDPQLCHHDQCTAGDTGLVVRPAGHVGGDDDDQWQHRGAYCLPEDTLNMLLVNAAHAEGLLCKIDVCGAACSDSLTAATRWLQPGPATPKVCSKHLHPDRGRAAGRCLQHPKSRPAAHGQRVRQHPSGYAKHRTRTARGRLKLRHAVSVPDRLHDAGPRSWSSRSQTACIFPSGRVEVAGNRNLLQLEHVKARRIDDLMTARADREYALSLALTPGAAGTP